MKHRQRLYVAAVAALVMLVAARHPAPELRLLPSDMPELAPNRVVAAVDLGVAGLSLVYSWNAPIGR